MWSREPGMCRPQGGITSHNTNCQHRPHADRTRPAERKKKRTTPGLVRHCRAGLPFALALARANPGLHFRFFSLQCFLRCLTRAIFALTRSSSCLILTLVPCSLRPGSILFLLCQENIPRSPVFCGSFRSPYFRFCRLTSRSAQAWSILSFCFGTRVKEKEHAADARQPAKRYFLCFQLLLSSKKTVAKFRPK